MAIITKTMPKHFEYIFVPIQGSYYSTNPVDSGELLDNFLARYGILIDDYAQFVRIIRGNMHFYYRHYGGKISINIHYV